MQLQLIQGSFSKEEALHILTEVIRVKIKFHEAKIEASSNEEDIKMRERRIKQLQKDFSEARLFMLSKGGRMELQAAVELA